MANISERHEVRMRAPDSTIVFVADSVDGKLVIRQEHDAGESKDVCAITLANPDELRAFFKGLRAIAASLEQQVSGEEPAEVPARTRSRARVNDRFNEDTDQVRERPRDGAD